MEEDNEDKPKEDDFLPQAKAFFGGSDGLGDQIEYLKANLLNLNLEEITDLKK